MSAGGLQDNGEKTQQNIQVSLVARQAIEHLGPVRFLILRSL